MTSFLTPQHNGLNISKKVALTLQAHSFLMQLDSLLIPRSNFFLIITNYYVWYQRNLPNCILKFEVFVRKNNDIEPFMSTQDSCWNFPLKITFFRTKCVSTFWSLEVPKRQHRQEEMTQEKWQFSYLPSNAELGVINEWLDHTWHFTKWITITPVRANTQTHMHTLQVE